MYRHVDAVLIRAAAFAPEGVYCWPDLTCVDTEQAGWRQWLEQILRIPGFADALEHASHALADRIRAVVDADTNDSDSRRVVVSVLRYLLRATTRATPFGLFAGVAPARVAAAGAVRVGGADQQITHPDAHWLTTFVDLLEDDPRIREHLLVRANNLLTERDGQLLLENRASATPGGAPAHMLVRLSDPVRAALDLACAPIAVRELADKLAAGFSTTAHTANILVSKMIRQRILLTNIRPPMAASDPLAVIIDAIEGAGCDLSATRVRLHCLYEETTHRRSALNSVAARDRRKQVLEAGTLAGHQTPVPADVDLRLDLDLDLPQILLNEAVRIATVLARLTTPAGTGWPAWHRRFLDRYGPNALVPVTEAVDPNLGLGYPAGYPSAPATPVPVLTHRDRDLLTLAQQAALTGRREIVFDEATIARLAGSATGAVQPHFELAVRVEAPSMDAIEAGNFDMAVTGVSRAAGTYTGRFLSMLDPSDLDRMTVAYAAVPTAARGALRVQLSAATPYVSTGDVTRVPRLLPLLPVGEYHADEPDLVPLSDIAVTATTSDLHLVSLSRRQVVEPMTFNAVNPIGYTLPIARFLAETPTALRTSCTPFDWGAAAELPFLPAVRYRRTILSPAQWRLPAADLPAPGAAWPAFAQALSAWQKNTGCPRHVYLGHSDQHIALDLDEPAHQALLRDHLARNPRALLRAAPEPQAARWLGGRPHEIIIPVASTADAPAPPRLPDHTVSVREHGHLPGHANRLYLRIYARPAQQTAILTRHLPALLQQLPSDTSWWFQRYGDPDPHLRLRLIASRTEAITAWTAQLRQAGLSARVQIDTDFPETARFGGPAAMPTAEAYFAADSEAALSQLSATADRPGNDAVALTTASLFDLATAVCGGPEHAADWLISNTRPHRPGPSRDLYQRALALAGLNSANQIAALPHGRPVLDAWTQRRNAVARYRDRLPAATLTAMLPDLLHLHHTRIVGVDLDGERACLHLVRAAALSHNARTRKTR